ncbi:MAG: hypothetical protein ACMG6E_06040 [Candidatus Roizmanbacteria bacterium]
MLLLNEIVIELFNTMLHLLLLSHPLVLGHLLLTYLLPGIVLGALSLRGVVCGGAE